MDALAELAWNILGKPDRDLVTDPADPNPQIKHVLEVCVVSHDDLELVARNFDFERIQ